MLNKKFGIVTLVCLLCLCVAMLFTACSGTQGEKGDKGENGADGKDGISIVSVEKADSEGLVDTYRITYSDGKTTIFTVTNGKDGVDGSDGEDGTDGENGKDGISITDVDINASGELVISFSEGSPVNLGKVVGADGDDGQDGKNGISIKGATVDDNGNLILTLSDESEINAGKVKGENGVDGKDGISISGVEINESGELVLSFSDGKQNNLGKIIGKDGKDGIGIAEIELDENYNLIIYYSNGETQNLGNIRGEKGEQGKDGVSIVSVEKTGTDGLKDTYMITYSDGKTTIFTVTNGKDGVDGSDGEDGISITDVDINESGELVISFSEGSPVNLGKIIGADGDDGQDGIGIEKARVDENGDLILTLSNATEINVGNVKGENGADGQNGISISGVEINELGELVISFSDGNQSNLGNIIGKDGTNGQDGVGIDRIELDNDCNLTIYLTNDTEIPLGCIRGEKGENGADGKDGKSAYELYKEKFGYEGTEEQWLIDLANGNLAVVETHTVTFDAQGGSPVPEPQEVKYLGKANKPDNPVKEGYNFDGWYCGDEKWSFVGYVVTEDITLVAKWTDVRSECLQYIREKGGYTVSGYTGAPKEIVVPDYYSGMPVLAISDNAFYNCRSLTSITFGENSQLTSIGNAAFYSCNLTNIEIPSCVNSIGGSAFFVCGSLTNIKIPSSVTSIGDEAFFGCDNLRSVTFGENSQLTSISGSAFRQCSSLINIKIPSNVTSIGDEAFLDCGSLTSVIFEENSRLTSIGGSAFFNCRSLTNIEIPSSVTSIGDEAFKDCCNLTTVYYHGASETEWNEINIDSYNSELISATRYYYSEEKPTTEGNYWHYVNDIPSKWEWGENKRFHFEVNGGNKIADIIAPALTELPYPIKEGYIFLGWYNNAEFTGTSITLPYYDAEKTTLYAKWIEIEGNQSAGLEIENGVIVGIGSCTDTELILNMPIAERAFVGCNTITKVVLGEGVTSIGAQAFGDSGIGCQNLKEVVFESAVPPEIGSDVFGTTWNASDFRVYVPAESLEAYEAVDAKHWQTNLVGNDKLQGI